MKNLKVQAMKSEMKERYGTDFSEEVFDKALEKLKRWMRKAFQSLDWNEVGVESIDAYYIETLKKPDGKKTFNRGY